MKIDTLKAATRYALRSTAYLSHIPKRTNKRGFANSRNCLFIWIPKAAGTSIYTWLNQELGMLKLKELLAVKGGFPQTGPVTFSHMDYQKLRRLNHITEDFHQNSYKFSFVRNPYDRAVSLYHYLHKRGRINTIEDFMDRLSKKEIEPIGLYNSKGLSQANPQVRWLLNKDHQWIVDEIFKMEDFETEIERLSIKLKIKPRIIHKNKADTSNKSKEILKNQRFREIIEDFYDEDFHYLGYDKRPSM